MEVAPSQLSEIVDYLKKNFAKGYSEETLKYSLIKQGYSRTSVEKAIETLGKQSSSSAQQKAKPKVIVDEDLIRRRLESEEDNRNHSTGGGIRGFLRKIFD